MESPSEVRVTVYNSKSQKLETFEPYDPNQVKIYCCGPTVYGLLHIGNFRGPVFYNFLKNWLEFLGYKVKYVYNFTDVDDKIIKRAQEEGVTPQALAEKYIKEFWVDFNRLGLKPHDSNPRVTETMDEICHFIEKLIESNHAYSTQTGDVYFNIETFEPYGALSGQKTEELKKAVRIEADENKKGALDFALWKSAKKGEPYWTSPWGQGRPGWHIECSAMIKKHLGDQIDIHGGGLDLLFPHHENEVAQSECVTQKSFVKYWIHNNMIQMSGAKMSKSLGNIISTREFLDKYHPEIYKFLVLNVHYRSLLDVSDESISQSIKSLARFYSSLFLAQEILMLQKEEEIDLAFQNYVKDLRLKMITEASKDFNTSIIMTHLHDLVRSFNQKIKRGITPSKKQKFISALFLKAFEEFGDLLSLFKENPKEFLIFLDNHLLKEKGLERNKIQEKVQERSRFRKEKDFAAADKVRAELDAWGILVSDMPSGECYWEVAK